MDTDHRSARSGLEAGRVVCLSVFLGHALERVALFVVESLMEKEDIADVNAKLPKLLAQLFKGMRTEATSGECAQMFAAQIYAYGARLVNWKGGVRDGA